MVRGRLRAAAKALGVGAGILALTALLLELLLQGAALFARDRAGAWREGAPYRVLAVGDSHAYGSFVPREQAFPAQLQRQLDRRERGFYSVLNRGIPGMSTTQIRNRLPVWLSRHRPDLVIVWVGINNSWNTSETDRDASALAARLAGLATHSRLYRFVRVWLHDRGLERDVAERPPAWEVRGVEGALGPVERWMVRHDGRVERIVHERRPEQEAEEAQVEARARRDYALMVEQARAAGAELLFVTYPYDASWFAVVNRAMREVAREHDVPLVNSSVSVKRLPPDQQELLWAAHPTGPMYGEIARDMLPHVPELDALREAG